jgi:hypothetical protein
MTKNNILQIPEAIAYQLMQDIFTVEGKVIANKDGEPNNNLTKVSKQEILKTYQECILAVRTPIR